MEPLTKKLLALTEQPYDSYNAILPEVKGLLGDRTQEFERTLGQELPLTTARRAYRTAIKVAMGEPDVAREWRPSENFRKR
jgi:hypothetical protein